MDESGEGSSFVFTNSGGPEEVVYRRIGGDEGRDGLPCGSLRLLVPSGGRPAPCACCCC